jgi:type IV secretion system protein VirB11
MTSAAPSLIHHILKPLAPVLVDSRTEDIAINQPNEIWIRRQGRWDRETVEFSADECLDVAILAGALRRQEIGSTDPLLAAELPSGERLQACVPPAVPTGTVALSIRKHADTVAPMASLHRRYKTAEWHRWRSERATRDMGALLAAFDTGDLEIFLYQAVRARLNILLAGPTGSGKTTLSRSMLSAIDPGERIITIEDALELSGLPPNHVRLLYSKSDYNGVAALGAESLLQASLRMRPDRVLLQELRDEAAWIYVNEICTGHPGSITTIHGRGAAEAFRRLFALAKGSPKGAALEDETLLNLLSASIDVIVPLSESGGTFAIGAVWFIADAERRRETAADLLTAA